MHILSETNITQDTTATCKGLLSDCIDLAVVLVVDFFNTECSVKVLDSYSGVMNKHTMLRDKRAKSFYTKYFGLPHDQKIAYIPTHICSEEVLL